MSDQNLTQIILDDTIKRYVDAGTELNINILSRRIDSSSATIWRILKRPSQITAETWIKLMRGLDNFDIDLNNFSIRIELSKTAQNKDILRKIKFLDFKKTYGNDQT